MQREEAFKVYVTESMRGLIKHFASADMPSYYDLIHQEDEPTETEEEIISRISGKLRDMGNECI